MSKLFKNIFLGFLAVILLSSGFCRQVGAVSMTGYFSGKTQQVADGEHVISGGLSKTINSVSGLVSALQSKYSSGSYQDKVGAAFIVNTFIESKGYAKTLNLDSKYWTAFEEYLNYYQKNNGINWNNWLNLQDSSTLNGLNSLYSPSMLDDRFYYDDRNIGVNVISFTNTDGSFAYAIKFDCGNPVGDPNIVPPPVITEPTVPASGKCRPIIITAQDPKWSSATDYEFTSNTKTGATRGGDPITVYVKVYKLNSSGGITGSPVFSKSVSNGTVISDIALTSSCTTGDKYQVSYSTNNYYYSAGPGTPHTYYTGKRPHRTKHTYYTYSGLRRIDTWTQQIGPCYDYSLKSSIQSLTTYQVEVGATVNITPTISNSSWTQTNYLDFWNIYKTSTQSKATEWQISRLKIDNGNSIPNTAAASVEVNPCSFYNSAKGFSKCAAEKTGTNVILRKDSTNMTINGVNPIPSFSVTIGDEEAGTKVCFALSLRSSTSEGSSGSNNNESATPSNVWYHSSVSKSSCVIVVKKPKVQVLGGDIKTGRSFDGVNPVVQKLNILTLNSVKSVDGQLKTFGSWAEYGLFASGTIRGMASGSAFNGGMTATSSGTPQSNYSTLSFSNSGSTGVCGSSTNGCYSYGKATIPDISASYPVSTAVKTLSGAVNLDSLTTSGVYKFSNHLSITGGTIPKGRWIIINAADSNSTVVIDGNINYATNRVTSLNDIPQLVIIAKNIEIADSVSNIDSWLIAKGGYLNTCETHRTAKLSTSDCDVKLTINGPVMASTLYLRRTAGSGTMSKSNDPSEVFNLRADAYLWAYARSTGSGRVWTVYTTNVPARL